MLKRALLSVSDKAGLVDLARGLASRDVELVASGGTAKALASAGLTVTTVESVTGWPEMIGGRVKTLHPAVHAGILARRTPEHLQELADHQLAPIDLVVVNLYPFESTVSRPETTFEEAVEQIDIGGVALLRAAAKNMLWVTVACDPADYPEILEEIGRTGDTTPELRERLAAKAFRRTAAYDGAISSYLTRRLSASEFPQAVTLSLEKIRDLRYGENPHQHAALYHVPHEIGLADARQLHGKELSYTNWLDVDAAWRAVNDFQAPTAVIVKHNTPSGIASAEAIAQAYRDARECDPTSAFGGVVALNRTVNEETARAIFELFTEVVIAPGFDGEASAVLQAKKDLRLLELAAARPGGWEWRGTVGAWLVQELDTGDAAEWRVVSKREPTADEMAALKFAWRADKFVKSNAIVLATGTRTVGIGAGQMSRVDSVKIAVEKAGDRARGAVLASDAFFPFPDGVEAACKAGVTAIAHPGGSLRDGDSIEVADRYGVAMVFTGTRHFRH